MARDELVVNKGGKTRRATDEAHFARLIEAGWAKGRQPAKPKPKPKPEPDQDG